MATSQVFMKTWQKMGTSEFVIGSTFIYGVSQGIERDFLNIPMTGMFNCCINGFICSIGGMMLDGIVLPKVKPVIPLILATATTYQLYNKLWLSKYNNYSIYIKKNE